MNIVILCGKNFNQFALSNKIAKEFNVSAVIVENKIGKRKHSFGSLINDCLDRTIFNVIRKSWKTLQHYYQSQYPTLPKTKIFHVANINSSIVYNILNEIQPDLIVVSGTSIIKSPVISYNSKYGIINLHTGISPYMKGGPNCTNWCISLGNFGLIGNSIMWLDAGIDTGRLICTERTRLSGQESLAELHLKVMEHAHDLLIRSIRKVKTDYHNVKSIPQNQIGIGKTFYTKDWNNYRKLCLIINMKKKQRMNTISENIITLDL